MIKSMTQWTFEWRREMGLLIWWQIAKTRIIDPFCRDYSGDTLVIGKGLHLDLYKDNQIESRLSQKLLKNILDSPQFFKKYQKEINLERRQLFQFGKELLKIDFRRASDKMLIDYLKKFEKIYRQHGVAIIRTFNIEGPGYLREFLEKTGVRNIEKWLTILCSSSKESRFRQEEKDLIKIATKIKRNSELFNLFEQGKVNNKNDLLKFPPILNLLNRHYQKYCWLPCGYANESEWTITNFLERIKEVLKRDKNPGASLKNLGKDRQLLLKSKARILSKLKSSSIRRLIRIIDEFTYYKDFIRINYNFLHFAIKPLLEELSHRLKLEIKDLLLLSPPEIISLLGKRRRVEDLMNKINKRKKIYVVYTQNNKKIYIKEGRRAWEWLKSNFQEQFSSKQKEISGQCANPGQARGRAKVITKLDQLRDRDKNFILVTPMTTPDLVPAVKKALAIVTDEGGITCHAAIVSRELNVPCIIGTKIATRVLKDGQLVEVDADKGIVKLIKK